MALLRLTYMLNRQVPDMARGFTISTNYGDVVIEPGPLADSVAKAVRLALEAELATLQKQAPAQ